MSAGSEVEFLVALSQLNTKLVKRMDGWVWLHGLSFSEFALMFELDRAPEKTLARGKLAEIMGLSASGITRMLAPMEKNGITEREVNPRDARMSLVKLSKAGQNLYQDALVSFGNAAREVTGNLSASQLEKIIQYTGKLV